MPRRGESIYKRKDGRWEARYIHHYEHGQAQYRYLYAHSYAEVKAKRIEEQSRTEQHFVSSVKNVATFHEIAELWLANVKPTVKESTYTRYHRIVHIYLSPALGKFMLTKLDEQSIEDMCSSLLCGSKEHKALSAKTVSDMMCVLKSIFKFGNRNGYPCKNLKAVKLPPVSKKQAQILPDYKRKSVEQCLLYADVNDTDSRVKLGILIALYTGVRIGELCGLKYTDIDLQSRCMTISRTVERIANLDVGAKSRTKVIISEPKTDASIRVIPLPSCLIEPLSHIPPDLNSYLLTGTEHYTEPHQFYMRYKTFMRKMDMGEYTFHALRHTFATRCIDNGFDAKVLSEILGHSNVCTTLSLYVHPTLEQKRRQMEKLDPVVHS